MNSRRRVASSSGNSRSRSRSRNRFECGVRLASKELDHVDAEMSLRPFAFRGIARGRSFEIRPYTIIPLPRSVIAPLVPRCGIPTRIKYMATRG